jgi:hypothetical protein
MWPSTVLRFAPIVTTDMWLPPALRHAAISPGHWFFRRRVGAGRDDPLSVRKFDPDGRVIACPFAAPHLAIDLGGDQALRNGRAQQQMIDAQPGVAGKGVTEIPPESVDPVIRVQRPQRVGPALLNKAPIGAAWRAYAHQFSTASRYLI